MKLGPFEFRPGLTLGPITRHKDEDVVGYSTCDDNILAIPRGVYVVADGPEIFYIGKFEQTFGKRWVYSTGKRLYHSVRNLVHEELTKGRALTVYVQDEAKLKKDSGVDSSWVNVSGIEAALIRLYRPKWNRYGLRDLPEDV